MTSRSIAIIGFVSCFALTACDPSGSSDGSAGGTGIIDSNLKCAALISAVTHLAARGEVENDPVVAKRALVTSMTYLNAYSIPKRLKEAEAFKEVNSARESLIENLSPDEIMSSAKRCIDRSP